MAAGRALRISVQRVDEAALAEDQNQRGEAQGVRQARVVEVEPQLADHDPQPQEQHQGRQSEAGAEAGSQDGGEQEEGPEQQHLIQFHAASFRGVYADAACANWHGRLTAS